LLHADIDTSILLLHYSQCKCNVLEISVMSVDVIAFSEHYINLMSV